MFKFRPLVLALAGFCFVYSTRAAGFADVVISYSPGTGFASGFTNSSVTLGAPTTTANPFSPAFRNTQLVSVGTNGFLTVQFTSPILNDPAHVYGLDFAIFGNAGFIITNGNFSGGGITDGTLLGHNPGVTRVSVSQDNINFYTLNPALAPTVDGAFPTDGGSNVHFAVNPALGQSDFAAQGLAGIRSLYNGSAGGSGFDISWAQDTNGNSVALSDISYIRVDVLSGKSEIDAFSAVPEPATCALGLLGAFAAFLAGSRRIRVTSVCAFFIAAATGAHAGNLSENFSTDPATHGWQSYGNTSLFHWNNTNQNLDVTWDSSQPNSFFHHPLGTLLTTNDDFTLSFDLQLKDIAIGTDGAKSSTFEIAVGLLNFATATTPGFLRGTGFDSPNIVEFNYFPDPGFGATVSSTIISTNNQFAFGYAILELTVSNLYHINMTYSSASRTLVTTMTRNGEPFGPISDTALDTNFTAFSVDEIAITSYSDAGQDPLYAGSILAHGTVDNVFVGIPPITSITGAVNGANWQAHFKSLYELVWDVLERALDFQSWSPVSPLTAGTGAALTLSDTNALTAKAFYRVRAESP